MSPEYLAELKEELRKEILEEQLLSSEDSYYIGELERESYQLAMMEYGEKLTKKFLSLVDMGVITSDEYAYINQIICKQASV
jgi:hypothetical protein